MIIRSLILAGCFLCFGLPFARAQQDPLPTSEVAPGVFVHVGATELMTKENEGAIANVG